MGNGFWEPTDKKKKTSVGKLNGMTEVTPPTIAYAIAQVCQACLSHPSLPSLFSVAIWPIVLQGMGSRRRKFHLGKVLQNDLGAF